MMNVVNGCLPDLFSIDTVKYQDEKISSSIGSMFGDHPVLLPEQAQVR